jgi:hypothetical protein
MASLDDLKQMSEKKSRECKVQSSAFSISLGVLAPANFIFVVGAALLSLVAGASILIENQIIFNLQAGIMAIVSGGFTIIHSKLGCDQYQAECKKLVSYYKGIAEDYSNLSLIGDADELKKELDALNKELSKTIKNSSIFPFDWAIDLANKRSTQ